MSTRLTLRCVALGYLALLLIAPVAMIVGHTFQHGFGSFWRAISQPDAVHALRLTVEIALITVPLNTLFGIVIAQLSALAAVSSIVCHAALPPSKAALRTQRSGWSNNERRWDIGNFLREPSGKTMSNRSFDETVS